MSVHGTTAGVKRGCACPRCELHRTTLDHMPRATKPPKALKIGSATLYLDDSGIVPLPYAWVQMDSYATVRQGKAVVMVKAYMTSGTWSVVKGDDDLITLMQTLISNAEHTMPVSVKKDLSTYDEWRMTHGRGQEVSPPAAPQVRTTDVAAMVLQLQAIVGGLATGEVTKDVAMKVYGGLRDRVASERAAFAEAEALFEVLQQQIVRAYQ